MIRPLLRLAVIPTAVAAVWLLFVTSAVLPARDPAHVLAWRAVTLLCFLLVGTTWAGLRVERLEGALRAALLVLSLAALLFGLYAITTMAQAPATRFEGYVLLIGLILAVHGMAGLLYGGRIGAARARARSAADATG